MVTTDNRRSDQGGVDLNNVALKSEGTYYLAGNG